MATQIDIDQPPAAGLAGEHAGSVADDSDHRLQALRKKLARRAEPDRSQLFRRTFQIAFLLLNLWIGGAFYFWVRGFELGIHDRNSLRPAGVEGWLPIAGLMNLKYWLTSGHLPGIHPAALFLFLSFLAIAFLFRKAFCSWLCPVGTLSEFLWRAGRRILRRNFSLPRWLDLPLRSLKYVLLGFFVWAVGNMSADAVEEFMRSPYGVIADVRMLNFFRYVGGTAAVILALLVVASVLVQNFWCRYLCPYGALLGIASLLSPFRIRRSADACIDCAKCAKACPSALPVDKLVSIKSANAQDAWNVSRCVRRKARCRWRCRSGRGRRSNLRKRSGFRHGPWLRESPCFFWASSDTRKLPAIGMAMCLTISTGNWFRRRMSWNIQRSKSDVQSFQE